MIRILTGDCRDVLPTLEANSVHCVVSSPPYYALRSYLDASHPDKHREIGSEPTPDAYIQTMVEVFREVKRVLRPDGTCWVNMGDSYASNAATAAGRAGFESHRGSDTPTLNTEHQGRNAYRGNGIKAKDLLMMPARLALALQADGWWLRSDIIWTKPNPMPESCRDRPTSAHEHVFLLTKRSRYFYDADAVREEATHGERFHGDYRDGGPAERTTSRNGRDDPDNTVSGRNLRNVWTIATHAYPEAHFATFPPELAERCIRAGTSERGCCAQCGKPWVRQSDTSYERNRHGHSGRTDASGSNGWDGGGYPNLRRVSTTTGWSSGCQCDAEVAPCVVLDPFSGAGTSGLVADRLGRDAVMIDLNHQYVEMARERLQRDCPLFADITDAPVPEPPEDERMADLFAEAAE